MILYLYCDSRDSDEEEDDSDDDSSLLKYDRTRGADLSPLSRQIRSSSLICRSNFGAIWHFSCESFPWKAYEATRRDPDESGQFFGDFISAFFSPLKSPHKPQVLFLKRTDPKTTTLSPSVATRIFLLMTWIPPTGIFSIRAMILCLF